MRGYIHLWFRFSMQKRACSSEAALCGARLASDDFTDRRQIFNRLSVLEIIAETSRKHRPPQRPPGFHARPMIVYPNVKIPSLPLLGIKGPLALLEPRIFENFEHGEEHGHSAEAI